MPLRLNLPPPLSVIGPANASRMLPSARAIAVESNRVRTMGAFDYSLEAALFSAKGTKFRQQALEYRLFARASEAIRFAIEDLPSSALRDCSLEVGDDHYVGDAILGLYESADFPLRRAKSLK